MLKRVFSVFWLHQKKRPYLLTSPLTIGMSTRIIPLMLEKLAKIFMWPSKRVLHWRNRDAVKCLITYEKLEKLTIQTKMRISKKEEMAMTNQNVNKEKGKIFTFYYVNYKLIKKTSLENASEKTPSFRQNVKFLGEFNSPDGNQPITRCVKALKNLKWAECKRDVMKFLSCLGALQLLQ